MPVGPYGTGLLDDFPTDGSTLGARYGADPTGLGFHPSLQVVSGQMGRGASGDFRANYTLTSYGRDAELWLQIKTVPNGGGVTLQTRLASTPGVAMTGYETTFSSTAAASGMNRLDNTTGGARTEVVLAGLDPHVWAINEWVAFATNGSSIETWSSTAADPVRSDWTRLAAATDTTYKNSGLFGIWMQNSTQFAADNLGGGSIPGTHIASLGRRPVPGIKGPDVDKIMGMGAF